MADPVLLTVDADAAALGDVERELRDRYAATTASSARDRRTRRSRSSPSSRMPGTRWPWCSRLSGSRGRPAASCSGGCGSSTPTPSVALLVAWGAWGDRPTAEAIFDAMALGRIDYYVLRPAASPDELFHQSISGFLLEWAEARRIAPHTIHVVGESWSGRAYELREVLQRCAVPHAFCLADSSEGRELVAKAGGEAKLPLVVLPDGRCWATRPTPRSPRPPAPRSTPSRDDFDVVIVGGGPAGLSAAVYGASEGFDTLVVDEGGIGGQATSSSLIRNYLGFPRGVSGRRLAERAYEQAWVFGANFAFMHTGDRPRARRRPAPRDASRTTAASAPAR